MSTLLEVAPFLPFLERSGSEIQRVGLGAGEKSFVGWFGPRGLARFVFAVVVLEEHLPNGDIMVLTVICTVLFSNLLHGLSARPFIRALNRSTRSSGQSE